VGWPRDGKDKADQIIPFSQYDSFDAEDLWKWMEDYEKSTGGKLLAIPHNGNLSLGLMFDDVTFTGKPLDSDYAERRQKWEPLYEITQMKGDGESHPKLSPNDEFADFETWDKASFGPGLHTDDMLPKEYAREAWSDDRKAGSDGKLPPVGNTVNVEEATYDNSIGSPFLQAYWKDPDFDPAQRAFYYVRVLEIPTPRWTTYDAKVFGVKLPDDVPVSIQERACTSPIWYTPG